ncbi:condensation domain-containing protein [Streptomyces bikiniensis]|uniref:condensation domain-containing protein n=1 Tax=Streptomyces bikiniensis TaxID=1896 RepID=UPI0004C03548|nr:condensation domain-containing protein [Streptomyces bikiniensis]
MTAYERDLPRPSKTRTVTVAHAGGEERRGPVALGQANMIRCMLRDEPEHINIHAVWPVPAGTRTDAVIDALRTLVVRHEALRTTFPRAAGAAEDAVPREQAVAAGGEFTVTVLDHDEPPPDPERYADAVARRARAGRFRLDRDFGLRISLVTVGGAPVFVALAASHAVTDVSALAVLEEDWRALLTGRPLPPQTAFTPLDLAAEEASPAGLRKSAASLRYWERIIRTGPQAMCDGPGAEGTGIATPEVTLRSLRGARALARVAARTGGLPSTVLLTAWCALVAHRTGQSVCVAAVPTSNRFHDRLVRSVNTVSQDALLALDVRVPSFDALLAKAWGAALDAYRHSRFDAVALWETIDRTTFERGSRFARDVVFNDVSALPGAGGSGPAPEGPDLELGRGPVQVLPTRLLAFVHETEPLLRIGLWADPALFAPGEAEGFLTGLVRLLEAAAEGDVPLASLTGATGVRPVERGPDWVRVDGCWVSPAAVADALGGALGGVPVHVVADGSGEGLTAFVASGGGAPPTPAEAHAALMRVLPGRPGVLAPRRYVCVQDPPEEADRTDAWLRQRILTEGNGRTPAI